MHPAHLPFRSSVSFNRLKLCPYAGHLLSVDCLPGISTFPHNNLDSCFWQLVFAGNFTSFLESQTLDITIERSLSLGIIAKLRLTGSRGAGGSDRMRLDRFTIKAQEALENAHTLADENNQQQIEPEHVLLALLRQENAITQPLL